MRKNKKPFGRWIGEAILIFISVFAAFYFDSYRDAKAKEKDYLRSLQDFKADLEENQGKFNFELNSIYIPSSGQGYINGEINKLTLFDSLLSKASRTNADSAIAMLQGSVITSLTPWIFISPQYDRMQSEYYSYIRNESLRARVQMHFRSNMSRIKVKQDINAYVEVFKDIEDQIRIEDGASVANRNVLFDVVTVNKVRRIRDNFITLRHFTRSAKESDSLILIQIEKELELWGIEQEEED